MADSKNTKRAATAAGYPGGKADRLRSDCRLGWLLWLARVAGIAVGRHAGCARRLAGLSVAACRSSAGATV